MHVVMLASIMGFVPPSSEGRPASALTIVLLAVGVLSVGVIIVFVRVRLWQRKCRKREAAESRDNQ